MRLKLQPATVEDAEAVAALRNAVSDDLTFKHGKGWWTHHCTTASVLVNLRQKELFVALHRDEAVASLVLGTQKPWSIDMNYLPRKKRPFYLSSMVVAPDLQRQGLGRACLTEVLKLARRAKAEAIFLDTYEHPLTGAGPFYARYGWHECGRGSVRAIPLIFYEHPL